MDKAWHSLSQTELLKKLRTSVSGLSSAQVEERRKTFGFNELSKYKLPSSFGVFLSQFNSPLVYVLLVAAVLTLLLQDWLDMGIIMLVVVCNSFFGWIQENKSNQAMAKLKQLEVPHAKVFRDGRKIDVEAKELVVGDIIFIKSGDKIPADSRIIKSNNLQCSEAPLTGEAVPENKAVGDLAIGASLGDRTNMVYSGTIAVAGWAEAVVCAVGINTEIGKIGKLVSEVKEERTPLQKQLSRFGSFLSLLVGFICLLVFLLGLSQGQDVSQMIVIAVALAVAAVPEGLLVAVTIILTVGMQVILKRKALVRKLSAAEGLGGVSVICSDKTGTLTEGKMRIHKIVTAGREYLLPRHLEGDILDKEQDLISKISVLCSNASVENPDAPLEKLRILGDPTEKALILGAIEAGHDPEELRLEYPRLDELPFDSELKFMATSNNHKGESHNHVFAKGAPEKILSFCDKVMVSGVKKKLTESHIKELKGKIDEMTSKGSRVLACAYKTKDKLNKIESELTGLVFVGFISLNDPLREDAKETVEQCRSAGIRVVMVTGDHKLTAKAIFSELGIKTEGHIIEGSELDDMSDEQLDDKLENIDIFARVEPHHKLRIVKAWQKRGGVVAMTGDGVNDSPALKAADVGIALGSGSDVAKETADIILLDDNFRVIVDAVRQGRVIFDNIRKIVFNLLAGAFSEIVLISGAIFLGLPLPLLAIQILWLNLVGSGLPNIALSFEEEEGDVMSLPPRKKKENILNTRMKFIIFGVIILTDLFVLFLIYNFGRGYEENHLRTMVFAMLGMANLLYIFSIKSLRGSILSLRTLNNPYLLAGVSISFLLLLIVISFPGPNVIFSTVPLSLTEWSFVFCLALLKLSFVETAKRFSLPQFILRQKNV
jgi:P-type Ca2+ transporter type 2C